MIEARTTRSYVWTYSLSLACIMALSVAAYTTQQNYRQNPIDFQSMPDGSFVPTRSLTRIQREEIKLGFVERGEPPTIGLFGNHQVSFMSRQDFGIDVPLRYFFNYFYANMGLPEMYDYLSYLADRNKLPSDLLIAQITTPNNDAGAHILTYMYELPPDLAHYASSASELSPWREFGDQLGTQTVLVRENLLNPWISHYPWLVKLYDRLSTSQRIRFLAVEHYIQAIAHFTHQSLSYATIAVALRSLIMGGVESRIVHADSCAPGSPDLIAAMISRGVACTRTDLHMAFRGDGSYDVKYFQSKPLKLDETEARPYSRFLRDGDEVVIAAFMERIDKLARERGRKLVFLVPPVYETERESLANTVLTKAIALVPHIAMIDDRNLVKEPEYFVNYDHPSPLYFGRLVSILRKRGLLPDSP